MSSKKKSGSRLLEPLAEDKIINISHKIRLEPNNVQRTYLNKAIGCSRLAYNWGLSEWKRAYEAGEKPTALTIRKSFNSIRRDRFPFTYDVARSVTNQAILDLGKAYLNFFQGRADYPRYKKKSYTRGSFYLDAENMKFRNVNPVSGQEIRACYVSIPKLGYVKMSEGLRFNGKINSCRISKIADEYFISFSMEISKEEYERTHEYARIKRKNKTCGIDIGNISAITLDNGYDTKSPKPLSKANKRYARLSKELSRKQHRRTKNDKTKASNNFVKALKRLAKLAARISNVREDFNHKQTSKVVAQNKFIAMETLNVKGMIKNKKLAKSINDVSYSDISSKIEYKAKYSNGYVYYADRFFPSSKRCVACKAKNSNLKITDRIFVCPSCGFTIDRDVGAAINLKMDMEHYLVGAARSEFTLAESSSMDDRSLSYLRSIYSSKQENNIKSNSKTVLC